ncbi:hypothetical protein OIU78_027555 [Salix suchowensis]|nr:hypothetical protein OIU78_027555 [Salix suchowensis]
MMSFITLVVHDRWTMFFAVCGTQWVLPSRVDLFLMHLVNLRRGKDYKILRRGAMFYGVWGWVRVLGYVKHAFCCCGKQWI